MKQGINPAVAGIVILLILVIAGFFLWKGTSGDSGKAPGEVGNAGPFSPGGAANGKASGPPTSH